MMKAAMEDAVGVWGDYLSKLRLVQQITHGKTCQTWLFKTITGCNAGSMGVHILV